MQKKIDPLQNFEETKKAIGYVPRKQATQEDYNRIGFMSGLEVHQQILTKEKLFCHCPAGKFNASDDYDAEIIRHMRPTLSELGEYDGTALMEFRTRKEIVYRIKNQTACTYEVDDTPPFPLNREALEKAIQISILSKLNIVGEVHITRKQYLDGSIPTGFQRTAIIGIEGEIPLKNKKIRLIQLSLEEDSCREISDIGHRRIYKTDRLGMPLIETVTYPDMVNPDEVMEAANYIRFLGRSTGLVRTGMGAGREDVNVSCKGGTRVEIKGVAHNKWIPELTHNECYRQWALLNVRDILLKRLPDWKNWKITYKQLDSHKITSDNKVILDAKEKGNKFYVVNLSNFYGILSHFTQPTKCFADEISDRLKVVACIEKPNMTNSEAFEELINAEDFEKIQRNINAGENDAQIIFWGPEDDIKTALETIEERCLMAFEEMPIPRETRKSFKNGSTIFERVLPGADRMYPDTDSKPIPLADELITKLGKNLPSEIIERYNQMKKWGIPEDTYNYIFQKNLYPAIEKIVNELKVNGRFVGTMFGHTLKWVEGHFIPSKDFNYSSVYDMFKYALDNKLDLEIIKKMLPVYYQHSQMDFDSVLVNIDFKKINKEEILSKIDFLKSKFDTIRINKEKDVEKHWIMGQLRLMALGNICLKELEQIVEKKSGITI